MKSIKQILILSFTLLLLSVSAANLIIGLISANNSINITVKDDMKSIGTTAEIAIQASMEKYKVMVSSIASQSFIGDPNLTPEEVMKNLERLRDQYGFESLMIADANGIAISTDPTKNGESIAEYDAFKRAMAGEFLMSSPTMDVNGELNVFANTKVNNIHGYQGIVSATIDEQVYSNIIKDIVVNKSGNIFIINSEGTMIANMRPELVAEQANFIENAKTDKAYESAAAIYSEMTAGKSGTGKYKFNGSERICYYSPIEGTDGWSYGVVAPVKEMTSSLIYTVYGLSISSLVFLLIGLFVAYRAASGIANPVRDMSDRIQLLSEGDLTSDISVIDRKDEIGTLNQSLINTVHFLREYITEISDVLGKISNGELNVEIEKDYIGDFVSIKDSMEKIAASLTDTMIEIKNSSDQVAIGSDQVSSGAQALSQGATEQASSIEQLSASIIEISDQVKSNAVNANNATSLVESVGKEIDRSNLHMQEMIRAISEISDKSAQIGRIIKTIDDIAFQTNILALNAAVEAARAGAAGKGFAVVADEVRNLAGKSAHAASETTELIESSISAVLNGTRIADETAESLSSVVTGASKITSLMQDISKASNEQANSIGQVTQGIEQISGVVQTNSATAEESAAASEELSAQAQLLNSLVSKFKMRH
ncbi:MAG: methyl-accepting chemotaxis protein [Clostridia bacterium]|nr:methyl-accepting chemotaxis protein [Clostridia bacterium]